ncbi:phage-related minor tail protein [Paraburkholderia sp. EB58]|uniref:phage tail length tape measure family protein n=1 Tax=Paraburkholderia sp. EB58 TaxID=3035125 RepID=UPI003D1B77FE
MPSLGSLIAKVSLDYADFELGADRSSQAALKMGNDIERAVTKALSTYKKSVGDMSAANDDLNGSMARASAGAAALAESEDQASARIKDMVARSLDAQQAMEGVASASEDAAGGMAAVGASADQVRANVQSQTQAMRDAMTATALMNDEMQALRTSLAQGGASFDAINEQYARLDRAMATGKLSMDEYNAALASIGKQEDARTASLNSLTAKYDPLSAATRKLTADQALLEDAFKTGAISSADYERALAGIKADQASVSLQQLAQQEAQLERSFKSGEISAAEYQKAIAGIGTNRAALVDLANGATASGEAMEGFGVKTAGARKELVVLAHEALTGNWSNFGGSVMVLAERMDLMEAATSGAGVAIAAIAAPTLAVGAAMVMVEAQNEKMNEALVLTGNYAGETVDGLRAMAEAATTGGASFNTAVDAISQLAATGKLTGSEIADLGKATADAATYTSVSVQQMVDDFTKLADDPVKASVALNDQYHYLTVSTYDQITALEKQGDATGAAQVAVEAFSSAMDARTQDIAKNEGVILSAWRSIRSAINDAIEAVGSFGAEASPAEMVARMQADKADRLPTGEWDQQDEADLQAEIAKRDAAIKQAQDKARMDRQNQEVIDAKHSYDTWNQQFATPAEKRAKEVQTYIDTIATPLNLSPDQQLADEQKINDKYKDKKPSSSAGLIDRTQLNGEVQAVKDALNQEVAAVQAARKVLDDQYRSGTVSITDYYTQDRNLLAQAASDHIDAANREAALLAQGMNNRQISASQRAQIANQIQKTEADASSAVEDFFQKVSESAAAEDEVWAKYGQAQVDALTKQATSLNQQDQQLKDQTDTFGMTKSAIDDLVVSRTQNQLAMEQEGLAMAQINNLSPDVIASYEQQIAALKEVLKAQQAVASDQSQLDQLNAEKKIADQTVQDWKSAANSIEQGITNALMNGFNNGKSFGEQLTDSLKSMFKTLVLQPIIAPIAGAMASVMYPGAAQAYSVTNPNSPLTGLFSNGSGLSSAYNSVRGWLGLAGTSSMVSGASSAVAGGLGSGLGGIGVDIGGDVAASPYLTASGLGLGANTFGFTTAGGSGPGLGGTLGSSAGLMYGGAGLLGGLAGGAMFGNSGYSSLGGSLGAMGGLALGASSAVAGTAIGTALGSFAGPIGAVVGSVLGSALGSLFGGGETRYGADYTVDGSGDISKVRGPSGGDPAATQTQQEITSTFTTIQSMAQQLGGSIEGLGPYSASYEVSPSKGNSFVSAGFGDLSGDAGREDLGGVKDSGTVLTDFSLQLQRSIIAGLQQANLDKPYADYLSQFNASTLTSDQVTQIEANLQAMESLFTAIKSMGSDFDNLKNASTSAQLAVINLAGGVDTFNTNASYFEQNFVPAGEQTAAQAKAVTDQLAALGESSVTTNDQFRQAVEGIDLSTDAGQRLYVQMLALAPAFNTMTQAAQSLWNNYYSAFYTSAQQADEAAKQLQAQFDALGVAMPKTNAEFEALVENMDTSTQTSKALQDSLLALAPTFAQVTAAVQAAIGAAQKASITTLSSSAEGLLTDSTNASSLLDSINTSITGSDPDTSAQVSALFSQLTSGVSLTQQIDLATQLNDLITKRYQTEQQAMATLVSQSQQLLSYVQGLKIGDLSSETPSEKLADAAQQYADTLAKAQGGDQTAIGNLSTAADNYLKLAQTYYASSDTYTQIFASVTSQLSAFGDDLQSQAESSGEISQQSLDQLTELRDIVAGQVSSADSQYQGVMAQLAQQLSALDAIEQAAGVQSEVPSILQGLPSALAAQLASIIGSGAATGADQVTSLYQTELGRTPDQSEVSYWTSSFANGSKTLADLQYSADQELVSNLYEQVLGRAADSAGLQYYTDQLYQGKTTLDQIKADMQYAAVNGSHAGGADNIPFDGYIAELHKGEAVVTSANNVKLSKMLDTDWSQYGSQNTVALVSGIKALHDRIGQLEAALVQATAQSTSTLVAASQKNAQTISAGTQKAADINQRTAAAKPPFK